MNPRASFRILIFYKTWSYRYTTNVIPSQCLNLGDVDTIPCTGTYRHCTVPYLQSQWRSPNPNTLPINLQHPSLLGNPGKQHTPTRLGRPLVVSQLAPTCPGAGT